MHIAPIDIAVIILYLILVTVIGFVVKSKNNKKNGKDDYLLGGKSLPFWMLGISNASGMFDISGTIWMVSIMFVYGVKSIWLVWLWPVFNQVFMFAYMSIWLRRSNASTGGEWMLFRFGKGASSQWSHKIIVAFALLSCFGFMAYGFVGLGKFIEIFIPHSFIKNYIPVSASFLPHFYGIVFTLVAVVYSILGGMKGIVWADIVQYLLMTIGSLSVAFIALSHFNGHSLPVPAGWDSLSFGWHLNLNWDSILPAVSQKIAEDKFVPFGMFFSLMTAKGILSSLAGPAPNYDMQKVLSTRSPREAALMSMFVNIVLLPVRYLMITGITVLGLLYYADLNLLTANGQLDFERILPATIAKIAPAGLMGLLLVELMAAFMGTFAGTLNAAQAYIVNDIYLKDVNPTAQNHQIQKVNYIAGVCIVLLSIGFGLYVESVNSVLQWIVGALYGGYAAANVLKWHWWRFNSTGYFLGIASGILSAICFPYIFQNTLPLYYFPLILLVSLVASVLGSLYSKPTENEVLKNFYATTRPWGFWKPVALMVKADNPGFVENQNFKRDILNVLVGTMAQTAITALPVFIVLMLWQKAIISAIILAICVIVLKYTWYKNLPKEL